MMQLTPEQRSEMERQRRDHPGRRRFTLAFTPAQLAEYRAAVAEEMQHRSANIARAGSTRDALREATFSGWLRRAIAASGVNQERIAEQLGIDASLINRFLAGEAAIDSTVIDGLVNLLGLAPQLEEVEQ
jgi:ribosome-binding protein aMBF1 (putative translation factor)